jgi:hypothetical protein
MNGLLFVAISLVAGFGSTAMSLVAGIWILDLTGSVSLAGLAGLCVYAPTLAAPWLGGLVDRFPRRRLVIIVDVALAPALLTLPAVGSAGRVWLIFAVMLAYGGRRGGTVRRRLPALVPALVAGADRGQRHRRRRAAVDAGRGGHRRADRHAGPAARPGVGDREHGDVRADRADQSARRGGGARGRPRTADHRRGRCADRRARVPLSGSRPG